MKQISVIFILLTIIAYCAQVAEARVPKDFNSDGRSELVVVRIDSDNRLNFFSYNLTSQQSAELGRIGKSGDHIIMTNWVGGSEPEIGVVSSEQGVLRWSILVAGETRNFDFGKSGDFAVSGADLDGSGYADAVTVGFEAGKRVWRVAYDPFNAGTRTEEFELGRVSDQLHFFKGASVDLPTVFSNRSRRLNALRTRVEGVNQQKRFASTDNVSQLASLGSNKLAFIKQEKGRSSISYRTIGELSDNKDFSLRTTGIAVVGDFLPDRPGLEVGFHSGSTLRVHDREGRRVVPFDTISGIAVDEINVNLVERDANEPLPPGGDESFLCAGKATTLGGFGDTFRRSDTRACSGPQRLSGSPFLSKGGFVPGLSNRTFVASISPCTFGRASLFTTSGQFILEGSNRGGCPNGRTTVDFCAPGGGGAVALAEKFGEQLILQWETQRGVECFRVFPRYTTRNGACVSNRSGVNEPGESPLRAGVCR